MTCIAVRAPPLPARPSEPPNGQRPNVCINAYQCSGVYSKFSIHALRARRLGEGCPTHAARRRAARGARRSLPASTRLETRRILTTGGWGQPARQMWERSHDARGATLSVSLITRLSATAVLCTLGRARHPRTYPRLFMHCPCERQRPARFAHSAITRRSRRRAGRAAPRRSG
jgi:hypothetical protein